MAKRTKEEEKRITEEATDIVLLQQFANQLRSMELPAVKGEKYKAVNADAKTLLNKISNHIELKIR